MDLDMDSGDAACYLGLRHQYSLADVVENLDQLDQAMLDGIVARDPLGFSVLCAPEEIEKSQNIGEQHLREIGGFLIERFDVVIVDGSRARELLGWRPSVSLEEGIARTVASYARSSTSS